MPADGSLPALPQTYFEPQMEANYFDSLSQYEISIGLKVDMCTLDYHFRLNGL